MIILDEPYVSDYLRKTIIKNNYDVLLNETSIDILGKNYVNLIEEKKAVEIFESNRKRKILTISENSIEQINNILKKHPVLDYIRYFKDKFYFRKIISEMYPDFYFIKADIDELNELNPNNIPFPVIIKPAVGFFSLGVMRIDNIKNWKSSIELLYSKVKNTNSYFPESVYDPSSFIIEKYIEGTEYAFDSYINADGEAVLINIFKHLFSGDDDVSDRVYITSRDLIREKYQAIKSFLDKIVSLTGIKNFPLHIEVREEKDGRIIPIEVNPQRFGGWCTTADLTQYAYGFNPYEIYFNESKPDWERILAQDNDNYYALVALDNSTGTDGSFIEYFNYEKLLKTFSKPLELRRTDFKKYPIFGFLFTETSKNKFAELESILHNNLTDFLGK